MCLMWPCLPGCIARRYTHCLDPREGRGALPSSACACVRAAATRAANYWASIRDRWTKPLASLQLRPANNDSTVWDQQPNYVDGISQKPISEVDFLKILCLFHPTLNEAFSPNLEGDKQRENVGWFTPRYPLISQSHTKKCGMKLMKSKLFHFDFLKMPRLGLKRGMKQTKHHKKSSSYQ